MRLFAFDFFVFLFLVILFQSAFLNSFFFFLNIETFQAHFLLGRFGRRGGDEPGGFGRFIPLGGFFLTFSLIRSILIV